MEGRRVYLLCTVVCILGTILGIVIQPVNCLERFRVQRCFKNDSLNVIDLLCKNDSWIHVIKQIYTKSISNDICKQADDNCTLEAEDNKGPSNNKLETDCNGKSQCTETLNPAYFKCIGRRMATVDYNCVPESINHNMCADVTATSNNTLYLRNPVFEKQTPSDMICSCTVTGKNIRVEVVDLQTNTDDDNRWSLNITSYSSLQNYSILSINTSQRLLNNILDGFHEMVHIVYHTQNTSNQNFWIELAGHRNSQMNISCFSSTQNIDNTSKTTSELSSTSTEIPTTNSSVTNSTSSVPSSTQAISPVTSSTTEYTTSFPSSTDSVRPSSTEKTLNVSSSYTQHTDEPGSDKQTLIISVVVVVIGVIIIAVVIAVCVIYRKRRNATRSLRDHLSPKNNSNMYFDINYSSDANELQEKTNNDYTEITLDDNEPVMYNDAIISDTTDNLYWTIEPQINNSLDNENEGFEKRGQYNTTMDKEDRRSNGTVNTGYSRDDAKESPIVKDDSSREFKGQHVTSPESIIKCIPAENMEENLVYNLGNTKLKDSPKYVPEEEMDENVLYNMGSSKSKDSPKCVPDEEMEENVLYNIGNRREKNTPKCVPDEEMEKRFPVEEKSNVSDEDESQFDSKYVPDEEMEMGPVYGRMENTNGTIIQKDINPSSNLDKNYSEHDEKYVPEKDNQISSVYSTIDERNNDRSTPDVDSHESSNSENGDPQYSPNCVPEDDMDVNALYYMADSGKHVRPLDQLQYNSEC